MPINFGKLNSGVWPASCPNEAILEGVMGLLPNRTRKQIMEGMERTLRENGSENLRNNFSLEFMYRHDSHVTDPGHPVVKAMQSAAQAAGLPGELTAFPASCDSCYYSNFLEMPGVVFGPGHLKHAHAADEQLAIEELREAGETLAHFAMNWK